MNRMFTGLSKPGMFVAAAGALVALAGCGDRLTVPNFNNPTVSAIAGDPLTAIALLGTGVLRDDRGNAPGWVLSVGILGRETYNYTPTEGRNTTGWLTADVNNNTSFGGGALWAGFYATVRDAVNTLSVVESATALTDAQKNAMRGLLHTEMALSLLYALDTRDSLGITVDVYADPTKLAPFVTRDSAFNYINGLLNQANTELGAGGASFPFTLHAGFAGFNTPATFSQFNRGIAARVNAYRASLGTGGCGAARSAACYQTVLTNLGSSFLNTSAAMTVGVYNVYTAAANDVANTNSNEASSSVVAQAKTDSGVATRADGTPDLRWSTKVFKLAQPKTGPTSIASVPTNWDFNIYKARTDPISVIRNEELILLRAEAKYFTGDQAGALADINTIRTVSGGLAARGAFASDSDFISELIYNRRWSLLFEGHRWIDMRRFGLLNQLTIDVPSHIVVAKLPVPQGECLSRINVAANLKAPGC